MNTLRVFLHDLVWQQDSAEFKKRKEQFLAISSKHPIRPIFSSSYSILLGALPEARPATPTHSPGFTIPDGCKAPAPRPTPSQDPGLEAYVKGLVGDFANDSRILAWDVWNQWQARTPR